MGASIAALCADERLWAGTGRSAATCERAAAAGLTDVGTLAALVERADVIVSVCPPGSAVDVAGQVVSAGFEGIYVDANAVSPSTVRSIATRFPRFVDGGIIGPPAGAPGTTRLYLCGDEAEQVAELWQGTALETRVIDGEVGAASAVKACFASWTKGTAALLLCIRALARAEGVEADLLGEWARSSPDLAHQSERHASTTAAKAWRFVGEMDQLADAFAAHDLPDGFLRAAADVYDRLSGFKDRPGDLDSVLAALLA